MTTRSFELKPVSGRKSFGGKCRCFMFSNNEMVLVSYNTPVAFTSGGKLHRCWSGYTSTTVSHVDAFASFAGVPFNGKQDWYAMPVEKLPSRLSKIDL